jgi:hypothetical protein
MTKARDIASAAPAPSTVSATELGYLDGVTSAIQTQLDAKTAKSTLTTTGDIYYASSANTPARLAIGSTSDVLTVVAGVPGWAAPAGGGKVLQVVSTLKTDTFTAASNSLVDITGYSVSITPTSATSKILVFVNLNGNGTNASNGAVFSVLRGATDIAVPSSPGNRDAGFGNIYINDAAQMGSTSITVLDTPATTSALTYKVQGQNTGTSGGSFYINRTVQDSNDNNHARTCSSITVMEIGA